MKKKVSVVAVVITLTLGSGPVRATGIPVIDVANLAKSIMQYVQLVQQYQTLMQQLQKLEEQVQTAHQQLQSMTGLNNFAEVFNSKYWNNWNGIDADAAMQEFGLKFDAPQSWTQETIQDKRQTHQLMARRAKALERRLEIAKQRFHHINQMIQKLDSANTLKAVNDLQARIAGEQAMLMNALLKMQLRRQMIKTKRIRRLAKERSEPPHSLLDYVDTTG